MLCGEKQIVIVLVPVTVLIASNYCHQHQEKVRMERDLNIQQFQLLQCNVSTT